MMQPTYRKRPPVRVGVFVSAQKMSDPVDKIHNLCYNKLLISQHDYGEINRHE